MSLYVALIFFLFAVSSYLTIGSISLIIDLLPVFECHALTLLVTLYCAYILVDCNSALLIAISDVAPVLRVAVSTVGLLFIGKLLEPIWGSREFLKLIFVVNFLTSICVFITAIALYYITRQESFLGIYLRRYINTSNIVDFGDTKQFGGPHQSVTTWRICHRKCMSEN